MKTCPKCILPLIEGLVLDNSHPLERSNIIGSKPTPSSGKLVKCLKCQLCGYSETIEESTKDKLPPFEEWSEQDKKTFQEFCEWGRRNCK